MVAYNPALFSDTVISHKKGITLQTHRAIRDIGQAIAEGATGAPRVQIGALQRLTAGNTDRAAWFGSSSAGIGQTVYTATFLTAQHGSVRLRCAYNTNTSGSGSYARFAVVRRRAYATVEIWSGTTAGAGNGEILVDASVQVGDEYYVSAKCVQASGSGFASVGGFTVRTETGEIFPVSQGGWVYYVTINS